MMKLSKRPLCIVVSAPSGAGKTTLCELLLKEFTAMSYSVSCTTRPLREGEKDGKDYIFLNEPEFRHRTEHGDFLEYANVHGCWYGTLRSNVERTLAKGRDVIMDIDVQGAESVRKLAKSSSYSMLEQAFVDVFIVPPSMDVLKTRLDKRHLDSEKNIRHRLQDAKSEMRCWKDYKYLVVNNDLDEAYCQLKSIVQAEHCMVDG